MSGKIYHLIQDFFIRWNHLWPVRQLGIFFYWISLKTAICILRKMESVVAIHCRTRFDEDFSPGRSDLDLIVVYEDFSSLRKEFDFLVAFRKKEMILNKYLPMFQGVVLKKETLFDRNSYPIFSRRQIKNNVVISDYNKALDSIRRQYDLMFFYLLAYWGEDRINVRNPLRAFKKFTLAAYKIKKGAKPGNNQDLEDCLTDDFDLDPVIASYATMPSGTGVYSSYLTIARLFYSMFRINGLLIQTNDQIISARFYGFGTEDLKDVSLAKSFVSHLDKKNLQASVVSPRRFDGGSSIYLVIKSEIAFDDFVLLCSHIIKARHYLGWFGERVDEIRNKDLNRRIVGRDTYEDLVLLPVVVSLAGLQNGFFTGHSFYKAERDILMEGGHLIFGQFPELSRCRFADYGNYLSRRKRFSNLELLENRFYEIEDVYLFFKKRIVFSSQMELESHFENETGLRVKDMDLYAKFEFAHNLFDDPDFQNFLRENSLSRET